MNMHVAAAAAAAENDSMTSGSDVTRAVSSSDLNTNTTFSNLHPGAGYYVSVAVSMRYGLGRPVGLTATTACEFASSFRRIKLHSVLIVTTSD